jgi:hypothetical protein
MKGSVGLVHRFTALFDAGERVASRELGRGVSRAVAALMGSDLVIERDGRTPHVTEDREVLYPWHPLVWTTVNVHLPRLLSSRGCAHNIPACNVAFPYRLAASGRLPGVVRQGTCPLG